MSIGSALFPWRRFLDPANARAQARAVASKIVFTNLVMDPLVFFPVFYVMKECALTRTLDARHRRGEMYISRERYVSLERSFFSLLFSSPLVFFLSVSRPRHHQVVAGRDGELGDRAVLCQLAHRPREFVDHLVPGALRNVRPYITTLARPLGRLRLLRLRRRPLRYPRRRQLNEPRARLCPAAK